MKKKNKTKTSSFKINIKKTLQELNLNDQYEVSDIFSTQGIINENLLEKSYHSKIIDLMYQLENENTYGSNTIIKLGNNVDYEINYSTTTKKKCNIEGIFQFKEYAIKMGNKSPFLREKNEYLNNLKKNLI